MYYNAFNVYRRELVPGTVSLTGDRAQGDDSKQWANSIAQWSGPPRTYVYFSQDQQGRLVYVRTAVSATCIKILSQVAQRNEDLIACSLL